MNVDKHRISAVIPTKNRKSDLCAAVQSVLDQSRRPDELVVIDQSRNEESRYIIEGMLASCSGVKLVYVYDPTIQGLVHAKEVSIRRASGDIICFLEDDVVLDRNYMHSMEEVFTANPEILGVCGVVTEGAKTHPLYLLFFHLFHRGIFSDPRVGVHGLADRAGDRLIQSDYLSGGVSAYRRKVFSEVPFDTVNGFHMLEDIDFSTRAAEHFGKRLFFINPGARLAHHFSPLGREHYGQRYQRKLREFILFYKKKRSKQWATLSLLWLLIGLQLEATAMSVMALRVSPLIGAFKGMLAGIRQPLLPVKSS